MIRYYKWVCLLALAALSTGSAWAATRIGVVAIQNHSTRKVPLELASETLAEMLRKNGFETTALAFQPPRVILRWIRPPRMLGSASNRSSTARLSSTPMRGPVISRPSKATTRHCVRSFPAFSSSTSACAPGRCRTRWSSPRRRWPILSRQKRR